MISYTNIERLGMSQDMQSWESWRSPLFGELIQELKPKDIIEVGSWKGVSACAMAELSASFGTHIHCVDNFLGDALHEIKGPSVPRDEWGYPTLFHQFMTNVKKMGYSNRITPYPFSSSAGAQYLTHRKVKAQLIFIDGDHSLYGAYQDLVNYWELLDSGGVMLVDDILVFAEVFAATIWFCCERGVDLKTVDPFGVLRKK